MDKLKSLFKKYREIIMYLFFGVATTAVNWITYILCDIGFELDDTKTTLIAVSNAIAWVVAVTFAYITNKFLVFESKDRTPRFVIIEALKFFGSRLVSGVFEIGLPSALIAIGLNQAVFGIEGAVAKAITSVVVIILNYIFSKLIVFRKKKQPNADENVTD